MLPELNPFIRYANILVVNDSHKTACIGLDCRIFYCLGGVAHIKIKDETVELSKGTIVFIPPYTKYSFCGFEKDKNISLAILNFDLTSSKADLVKPLAPVVYKEWDKEIEKNHVVFEEFSSYIVVNDARNFGESVMKIINLFFYKDGYFREKSSGILKTVLADLISKTNNENVSELAKEIIKYLREHYGENVTGSMLSDIFKYHPYHISREIKKATGMSLKAYLIDLKIKTASNMLSSTDKSITQIASECGFSDAAYFTKIFKRYKNLTPKEYRLKNKDVLV